MNKIMNNKKTLTLIAISTISILISFGVLTYFVFKDLLIGIMVYLIAFGWIFLISFFVFLVLSFVKKEKAKLFRKTSFALLGGYVVENIIAYIVLFLFA